jgi:ATP-dependent RNA helicase RhlE
MSFDEFGLDPRCLDALQKMEIVSPTPVQAEAIPIALERKDLVAVAQTGTGKTLGFLLPSLTHLAKTGPHQNQMLVLVPTRELCLQVHEVVAEIGPALGITSTTIYGGVNLERQATALHKGKHVIVATPGRLLDHMGRRNVRFDDLDTLVLDEADRMLDMGFLPDILRIIEQLPENRQTLMFSATFPEPIARLARRMMYEPERVTIGGISKPVETVRQLLYPVEQTQKTQLLLRLLEEEEPGPTLIFLRTKAATEVLSHTLKKKGYKIAELHGDRSQGQRTQALKGFREGKYDILVATDVAARGLDIEDVTHVFNYDIPLNPDDYVHRIGRTARAQKEGDAITFVTPGEWQALGSIEKALNMNIPRAEYDGSPRVLSVYKANGPAGSRRRSTTQRVVKRGRRRRR